MPKYQLLFSAVFGSRQLLLRIFSELHETKGQVPIFPAPSRSPKERRRGAPRCPHPLLTRVGPRPHRQGVWPPRASTDAAPSPIYSPRRENPKYPVNFHKEFRNAAAIVDKFRGTEVSVPARCRDGELPPEPSISTPSPSSSPLLTPMMRRE